MTSELSRRSFLRLAVAAAATGIVVPAFTPPRAPYVFEDEVVSHVGACGRDLPSFVGGTLVRKIERWDGVGFPCILRNQAFGCAAGDMQDRFYDFDLSNFLRDVPSDFWLEGGNAHRYPNVHAFVREQRFGEDPSVMWRRLGYERFARDAA
jgi:hypothetical protein